jgi:hypothetical protein
MDVQRIDAVQSVANELGEAERDRLHADYLSSVESE